MHTVLKGGQRDPAATTDADTAELAAADEGVDGSATNRQDLAGLFDSEQQPICAYGGVNGRARGCRPLD